MSPLNEIADFDRIGARATSQILTHAEAVFADPRPIEYEWFREREKLRTEDSVPTSTIRLESDCSSLIDDGRADVAWVIAQLYYDQVFKYGIAKGERQHLGNALFCIAAVADRLQHRTAARHYSALATIADVLWETRKPYLATRDGAAVHLLAAHTDRTTATRVAEGARALVSSLEDARPVFPECVLAALWFRGRSDRFLQLAYPTEGTTRPPFLVADKLRDKEMSTDAKGWMLEASAAFALATTPGYEVRGGFHGPSSQTDLIAYHVRDTPSSDPIADGYVLVECKNYAKPVSAAIVREFGARCVLDGVAVGVLVAGAGTTGEDKQALENARLERMRLLAHGITILVLSIDDLCDTYRDVASLSTRLRDDYETLRFGRRTATV